MPTNVLAFAETRGGDLRRAALEAVTAARAIADARGGQVHAVLFGAPGVGQHAAALGAHGADVVLVVEHAEGQELGVPAGGSLKGGVRVRHRTLGEGTAVTRFDAKG